MQSVFYAELSLFVQGKSSLENAVSNHLLTPPPSVKSVAITDTSRSDDTLYETTTDSVPSNSSIPGINLHSLLVLRYESILDCIHFSLFAVT